MNGLLLVNKESGYSSAHLTRIIRRISGQKKVGHSGTLDPLATGLLVVCLGSATKIIEYLQEEEKEYLADIRFQIKKDTVDEEGIVLASTDKLVKEKALRKSLLNFQGQVKQIPPMHSAIKHKGKRLFEYAREGKNIERKVRSINISSIDLEDFDYDKQLARIRVRCSAGTYIRTLIEDIASDLGNYGYMKFLKRTRCSGYVIDQAISVDDQSSPNKIKKNLISIDQVLDNYPKIQVDQFQANKLKDGMTLVLDGEYQQGLYLVKEKEKTIGTTYINTSEKGSLIKLSKHLYQ